MVMSSHVPQLTQSQMGPCLGDVKSTEPSRNLEAIKISQKVMATPCCIIVLAGLEFEPALDLCSCGWICVRLD